MGVHLPLQHLDQLADGGDHRDQRPDHRSASGGDLRRLGQLLGAQGSLDRGGLVRPVAAAGQLERRVDLRGGQPGRRDRVRGFGQQFQGVGGVQVVKRFQCRGKEVAQLVTQPLEMTGPFPDQCLMRGPRA